MVADFFPQQSVAGSAERMHGGQACTAVLAGLSWCVTKRVLVHANLAMCAWGSLQPMALQTCGCFCLACKVVDLSMLTQAHTLAFLSMQLLCVVPAQDVCIGNWVMGSVCSKLICALSKGDITNQASSHLV